MRAVCFSVNSLLQYMVLVFKFQQPSSHRVVADLSLKAFYLLESVCKQQPRLQIQHSPRPKQTFGINLETVSASLSTRYSEPKTWNRYPHSIVASAPRNNPRPHKYTKAPQARQPCATGKNSNSSAATTRVGYSPTATSHALIPTTNVSALRSLSIRGCRTWRVSLAWTPCVLLPGSGPHVGANDSRRSRNLMLHSDTGLAVSRSSSDGKAVLGLPPLMK